MGLTLVVRDPVCNITSPSRLIASTSLHVTFVVGVGCTCLLVLFVARAGIDAGRGAVVWHLACKEVEVARLDLFPVHVVVDAVGRSSS